MKLIISGRGIDITEALRKQINKKFGKLDKFFNPDTEAHVTLSVQKTRQIVEATIKHNNVLFRAEEDSHDIYASIDNIIDTIEGQIRKNKTRLEKRIRDGAFRKDTTTPEGTEIKEEVDFEVVRTKTFKVLPMSVDEAILQMNLLGHEFFLFRNTETNDMNVVYRRKSGGYGLLIPD